MSLIEQLADLVGFHHSYIDNYGNHILTTDAARHALLTAMGFDIHDEHALVSSINDWQQKPWLNLLPPVHIIKLEQAENPICLSLPDEGLPSLSWQILTENGQELTQEVAISDLNYQDSNNIDNIHYNKFLVHLPSLIQGYHQLTITYGKHQQSCPLIVAPETCYHPSNAAKEKLWGFAAQLYSLRSDNNWGIGDFSDLQALVTQANKQGASTIGLNPLHPLYQSNPAHRSPYSPTSRSFLNPIYINVEKIDNFSYCNEVQALITGEEFKVNLMKVRQAIKVDYIQVYQLKIKVLKILYEDFLQTGNSTDKVNFINYKKQQGKCLHNLTTFDALDIHFNQDLQHAHGWKSWPSAYQTPDSEAVREFQQHHAHDIDFLAYLQWQAHQQLLIVTHTAQQQGMPIGLYLDLAVGCDGSSVDVWSNKEVYVANAGLGAPPDAMNTLGQNWGLTPMNPVTLYEQAYQPLISALRSNMQYAGALRIDHILGLIRQYWIAPNMHPHEGVYITYPLDDILRIIALESRRNKCIVIGENLGTAPPGSAERIENAGLLSYKVLFFERWESGLFKRPTSFPQQSMVTVSTHDLPTLAGWWLGRDLEWRQELALYPNDEMGQTERNDRQTSRAQLLGALQDINVINSEQLPEQSPAKMNRELSLATQKFLAQAPSHLQLIPLEDTLELVEQVNIPGTIDQHPNWQQKLPVTLDELWQQESVIQMTATMNQVRPRQS